MKFALTEYIESVIPSAVYDELDDGSYAGRIPKSKRVIAFGKSLKMCEDELQSTLENWILVQLKIGVQIAGNKWH